MSDVRLLFHALLGMYNCGMIGFIATCSIYGNYNALNQYTFQSHVVHTTSFVSQALQIDSYFT